MTVVHRGRTVEHAILFDHLGPSDEENRFIREAIRQTAEACARVFPQPVSKYSDDLFKVDHTGTVTPAPVHDCSRYCGCDDFMDED